MVKRLSNLMVLIKMCNWSIWMNFSPVECISWKIVQFFTLDGVLWKLLNSTILRQLLLFFFFWLGIRGVKKLFKNPVKNLTICQKFCPIWLFSWNIVQFFGQCFLHELWKFWVHYHHYHYCWENNIDYLSNTNKRAKENNIQIKKR